MDLFNPETLKDLPAIALIAAIALASLALVSYMARSLLPFMSRLIEEQKELAKERERQDTNFAEERTRQDKEREAFYINTVLPMLETYKNVAALTGQAWEAKLEAVRFETEQRIKLMVEERDRERDLLRGRVATLEQGIKDRDLAIARMEAEIEILREEHQKALAKIRQSESEIKELKEFNLQKDARIADLKEALDKTIQERDGFAAELEQVKKRLEELSRAQIATDQSIHDSKDGKGSTPEPEST